MAFQFPVDIANKACQILGQPRITAADFANPGNTKQGASMAFVYDLVRRAELRRNIWRFATRRARLRPISVSSQNFQPSMWASGTTYVAGNIVFFNNYYWILELPTSTGNQPGTSSVWQAYFGPLVCDIYDPTFAYTVGELVLVPATWSGAVTYAAGAIIALAGVFYVSLIANNLNQNPATVTTAWAPWSNQNSAPLSFPTGWAVYLSLTNGNATLPPTGWVLLAGSISQLTMFWPVNSGPFSDSRTHNVLPLPNGFLREAPQDPKAGVGRVTLGGPVYNAPSDFVKEGNFIISQRFSPLNYRFVADVWDVLAFDDMFALGLAARMAMETAEELTGGNDKYTEAAKVYKDTMFDARAINALENSPTEPVEDDYLLVRL